MEYTQPTIANQIDRNTPKINFSSFLCSLNLVLIFVGYQASTVLLIPLGFGANSQLVTIPYRIFAFGIASCVFLLNLFSPKTRREDLSIPLVLYFICAALFFIRALVVSQSPSFFQIEGDPRKTFYFLCYGFLAPLSVFISFRRINLRLTLILTFFFILITSVLTVFFGINDIGVFTSATDIRADSTALFTIAVGYLGVSLYLLGLTISLEKNFNIVLRVIAVFGILFGMYTMLKSGSRSPLIAFAFVTFIFLFINRINLLLGIIMLGFAGLLVYIFRFELTTLTGYISPAIEARMNAFLFDGESSGRLELYAMAWKDFCEHPIFGTMQYSLPGYHSAIMDHFASMGFLFGIIMNVICIISLFCAIEIVKLRKQFPYSYWLALLSIMYFVYNMFFGALPFVTKYDWSSTIVLVFLIAASLRKNRTAMLNYRQ